MSGMVKHLFDDEYGEGAQSLVHHLAKKYPRLKTERHTCYFGEKGRHTTTKCIYIFVPEDEIVENLLLLMLDTVDRAKITIIVPWEQRKKQLDWNDGNVLLDASLVLNFTHDII